MGYLDSEAFLCINILFKNPTKLSMCNKVYNMFSCERGQYFWEILIARIPWRDVVILGIPEPEKFEMGVAWLMLLASRFHRSSICSQYRESRKRGNAPLGRKWKLTPFPECPGRENLSDCLIWRWLLLSCFLLSFAFLISWWVELQLGRNSFLFWGGGMKTKR